jgi:hypothetical protein
MTNELQDERSQREVGDESVVERTPTETLTQFADAADNVRRQLEHDPRVFDDPILDQSFDGSFGRAGYLRRRTRYTSASASEQDQSVTLPEEIPSTREIRWSVRATARDHIDDLTLEAPGYERFSFRFLRRGDELLIEVFHHQDIEYPRITDVVVLSHDSAGWRVVETRGQMQALGKPTVSEKGLSAERVENLAQRGALYLALMSDCIASGRLHQ